MDSQTTQTLREAVAAAFVTTGATTPAWPDPHPEGEPPLDEEYSRCLDPGKYRILKARSDAWVQALTDLGLAAMEEIRNPVGVWQDKRRRKDIDRTVRLRPVRAGAAPLVLGFRSMDGVADVLVHLGAGEPAVPESVLPHCECDACDDGSDVLLEEFDEKVLTVVTGTFRQGPMKNSRSTAWW